MLISPILYSIHLRSTEVAQLEGSGAPPHKPGMTSWLRPGRRPHGRSWGTLDSSTYQVLHGKFFWVISLYNQLRDELTAQCISDFLTVTFIMTRVTLWINRDWTASVRHVLSPMVVFNTVAVVWLLGTSTFPVEQGMPLTPRPTGQKCHSGKQREQEMRLGGTTKEGEYDQNIEMHV